MRNAYTTPPANIHYFTVQWPTDSLSWKSFRDDVRVCVCVRESVSVCVRV